MSYYKDIYDTSKLIPEKVSEVKEIVNQITKNRSRYETVCKAVDPTMPYWVVGLIHSLEAGGKFDRHLHNGDRLTSRTINEPKGYPRTGNPPFTWEYSAIDALTLEKNGNTVWKRFKDWSIESTLQKLEAYNGLGYKKNNLVNPYLWSYTSFYKKGKYAADGKYDPNLVSKQPGIAAIMKLLLNSSNNTPSNPNPNNTPEQAQDVSRGEIINQNQSVNQGKNNITGSGITNVFAATLKPNEISYDFKSLDPTRSEVAKGHGYIPIVWYNTYQIDAENLQFLSIYDDGLGPEMKLTFIDTIGLMKDKAFPLDDTRISVFLNSRSEQLKSIFLQFKITNFSNNNGTLSIESILDADGLYVKKFKSYSNKTSNQVLQEVCKEIGFGFNTNIVDTNDKMVWINSGKKTFDFISEVLDHAYISDESFVYGYIDNYYNFNFIDIQKEMSRDISNELGVVSNSLGDILKVNGTNDISNLLLTNDASANGSNMYFYSYKIINESTSTSLKNGYSDVIKYYDTNDKSLLNFKVESLNNNAQSSIILKGAPQDETFYNNNKNFVYGGKIDSDNSHKNFNYTKTQNNRNISDAQKIAIEIELSNPNYNIYRFQKIKVLISSNTPTPASSMINQRLSGDWFITQIKYIFFDKALKQVVTLIKRELELSSEELQSESTTNDTRGSYDSGRGNYTNPSPDPVISATSSAPVTLNKTYDYVDEKANVNGYLTNYPNLQQEANKYTFASVKDVVSIIKSSNLDEGSKRSLFTIIWIESKMEDGYFKGLNNNYTAIQTDSGRVLSPQYMSGQTPKKDGDTPKMYACFSDFTKFSQFLSDKISSKGFTNVKNGSDFANKYLKEWIGVPPNQSNIKSKSDIYDIAMKRYS